MTRVLAGSALATSVERNGRGGGGRRTRQVVKPRPQGFHALRGEIAELKEMLRGRA